MQFNGVCSNLNATISSNSSVPIPFDYDTDTLRRELTLEGFEPGPITNTTKRVYIKKLIELKRSSGSRVVNYTSTERGELFCHYRHDHLLPSHQAVSSESLPSV